jgi:Flp pilus assembly protein TadG
MSARRLLDERGQALVPVVAAMMVMLGMAGLVIDVGAWFHQQRAEQATADAAALAGAQALPDDPSQAVALALQYANKNGMSITSGDVGISTDRSANDTITVNVGAPAQTFFTQLFGVNSLTIHATAAARSDGISSARWVAPIVVPTTQPLLQCTPPPCAGATELSLLDLKQGGSSAGAGNFALLDLRQNGNGSPGNSTLADWMANGYDQAMPLGTYDGATGADFNSLLFNSALQDRVGTEVLFPVYQPPILLSGSNAQFNIVGWVGFLISGYQTHGSSGTVSGSFTRFIANGLEATTPSTQPDFGVRAVQLVK